MSKATLTMRDGTAIPVHSIELIIGQHAEQIHQPPSLPASLEVSGYFEVKYVDRQALLKLQRAAQVDPNL